MAYQPIFFSKQEFETYVSVIEAFICTNGNDAVSAIEVASRMDNLFSKVNNPQLDRMSQIFQGLNSYSFFRTLRKFKKLTISDRQKILNEIQEPGKFWKMVERIPGISGVSRDFIRGLKVLCSVGYYSHPMAKKQVGFIDFDDRLSSIGKIQIPKSYKPQ